MRCPSEISLAKTHVDEGLQSLSVTWEAAVLTMSLVSQGAELGDNQSTQSLVQAAHSPMNGPWRCWDALAVDQGQS